MMIRHFKYLFFIILIVASGCSTLPQAIDSVVTKQSCNKENKIYITNHGWHTGLAIKADDLNKAIPELTIRFPDSLYYEVGWGDADFYQSSKITIGSTLQALFLPSVTVIHVRSLKTNPPDKFKNSKVILLTSDDKNYQNLIAFISSSFKRDSNNKIILEGNSVYGDSQFYTSIGRYHILNTCNNWTAKALYSAGYDISPTLKLTSSSVMSAIDALCQN